MSELQVGLLGVGAVVVAAVFLYNKWQERRYRREAEAGFASRHEDVLMRPGGGAGPGTSSTSSGLERVEPVLVSFEAEAEAAGASRPGLSEFLDLIVPIETPEEVSGAALIGAAAPALERCSKLTSWEGFDETAASWEPLDPDRSYSRLRSGMQLVDRRGAADAEELAAFGAAIESAAASVGALAAVPDPAPALAKARELDRFCGEVDIRFAVHVVSDTGAFSGTRLGGLAQAAGFELDEPDGKFRHRDEAGRVICALANLEPSPFSIDGLRSLSTHGVTLELDVPRTPRGAFVQFRDSVQFFARELNARIVDDNRQPLGPAAFDAIGAQLRAIHRSMEARGIPPGGALALRLFS
ncbi:MAG TPA: cell division protein ZipA C-terminal FtsZ-binding domain-containing protein [Burkholderiales bacterium]|jgi:ZipA-like protein with FtsZ-binding domain|nr:cell division protein ZipA C-terminal FtsZ-binding domain-containing protein [Burkholderiales bacterium]